MTEWDTHVCVCVCAGLGVCGSTMQSSACAPEVFLADGKQRGACNTGQQQLHVCIIHQLRISEGRSCSPQVIEGSKGEHSIAHHKLQLVADLSGPCAHTAGVTLHHAGSTAPARHSARSQTQHLHA